MGDTSSRSNSDDGTLAWGRQASPACRTGHAVKFGVKQVRYRGRIGGAEKLCEKIRHTDQSHRCLLIIDEDRAPRG
jgi:hypothetical protein